MVKVPHSLAWRLNSPFNVSPTQSREYSASKTLLTEASSMSWSIGWVMTYYLLMKQAYKKWSVIYAAENISKNWYKHICLALLNLHQYIHCPLPFSTLQQFECLRRPPCSGNPLWVHFQVSKMLWFKGMNMWPSRYRGSMMGEQGVLAPWRRSVKQLLDGVGLQVWQTGMSCGWAVHLMWT